MANESNGIITRSEIKFWISLLAVVVGSVIAFTTLKMEVKAMQDKEFVLTKKVDIMMERQIKIMVELGIKP